MKYALHNSKSKKTYEMLQRLTSGGVSSPVRAWKNVHTAPFIVKSASQDMITDIDGNRYTQRD